jgi:polyisoprenoid-binding protein YceI
MDKDMTVLDRRLTRRMFALATLATAALLASAAIAALAAGEKDQLGFSATQMDVELNGEFRTFSADIDLDPARLANAKVNIVIDLSSVDTGSSDADTLLKGKGFFDVARFPRATFTSTSIQPAGPGKYLANGQFTLKGRSAGLVVPVSARSDGAGTWFDGSVPVSRLAYKVGEGEWADTGTLADQVQVVFKVHVRR